MILHLFTRVSDYSNEYLQMLTERFNPKDYVIVFRNDYRDQETLIRFPSIKIIFLGTRNDLISKMPALLKKSKKIIFHSFPISRSLFFWYRYRKYMKIAAWFVWGHDAYWFKYCKRSLSNRVYEFLRRQLFRKLNAIITPIKGDYEYVKEHYQTKAAYINCRYPVPTDFELLKSLRSEKSDKDFVNIQLGNSANPTNNLEEIIYYFGQSDNVSNYRFYCLLSYGDQRYAEKICKLGHEVLGESFKPVKNYMNRIEYANYISTIDVLIMNHQRQQGLGNILSFLFLGKKVYIRGDNSLYPFFEENGIKIYNTLDLFKSKDIHDVPYINSETVLDNIMKTEKLISWDSIVPQWKQIFA